MNKINYKPLKEKVDTDEILDSVFKDSSVKHGLQEFSKEILKRILPEALLVLAKSPILQIQLEKQCAGTILTAVPKERIKNIVIPVLNKSTQQKIADLVYQSHQARKKVKEL
jgi:type I restriction enzyme S subunit